MFAENERERERRILKAGRAERNQILFSTWERPARSPLHIAAFDDPEHLTS